LKKVSLSELVDQIFENREYWLSYFQYYFYKKKFKI